jgi:hypothetical protein
MRAISLAQGQVQSQSKVSEVQTQKGCPLWIRIELIGMHLRLARSGLCYEMLQATEQGTRFLTTPVCASTAHLQV